VLKATVSLFYVECSEAWVISQRNWAYL